MATEERRAKKRFADDYYRELFNALDQGFFTIEVLFDEHGAPADCRFVEVNAAFEQQTGLHDAIGHRMRELAPALEEHWFRIYGEVATTGIPVRFEQEALNRWYDVYAFRVGDSELHRVAILFSDVTARKHTEEALEAARRDANRANRAKDEFLAMLGHELRNPLAPMLTALQLMRLRGNESREMDVLDRQVRHLARMVDDLLDVSRITSGKIELRRRPVELRQVVTRAMELAGPLLEQRQHVVGVDVPDRGVVIDADLERMAQVVSNLLTNAAKYSAPGSTIVVAGRRADNVVTLRVRDEGVGLEPDMIDAVFEPFVQQGRSVDTVAGGLGLGLAIVWNLVTAHGGTARAESDGPNRGTEFIIELPAVDILPAKQDIVQDEMPPTTAKPHRILVVDDNHDAAEMLGAALEQMGYVVEVAFDGVSALAIADAFQPSTVLLDIGMPVMDGYEVARELQARRGGRAPLRLFALTGYGQDADLARSHETGFQHHFVKPIDLDRLRDFLESDTLA